MNELFDGDGVFLAMQERRLREVAVQGGAWDKAYYMPVQVGWLIK